MSEQGADVWHDRDLPVLREITRRLSAKPGESVYAHEIAATLTIDVNEARAAIVNLIRGHFLLEPSPSSRRLSARRGDTIIDITDRALYASETWPTPETALHRIIAALDQIAEHTDDADTRGNARKLGDWLKSSAQTVGIGVATAAITGQLPGQ